MVEKVEDFRMNKFVLAKADEGILLLRIAFGLMMMGHGWSKLSGFSGMSASFPDPLGVGSPVSLALAIFAELGCSLLLLLGALTRLALIPLIITMLVAIFVAHGNDPWNMKELAVAYLAVYGVLMLTGPGRYSLDHKLFGGK